MYLSFVRRESSGMEIQSIGPEDECSTQAADSEVKERARPETWLCRQPAQSLPRLGFCSSGWVIHLSAVLFLTLSTSYLQPSVH